MKEFLTQRTLLFVVAGIIPALVIFLTLVTFWMSFHKGTPGTESVLSIGNYLEIYGDRFTYQTLVNTAWFSVIATLVSLVLGVPIAWLTERTSMSYKPLVYALMMVGILIPAFFVAIGWVILLHPRIGFMNSWLRMLTGDATIVININTIPGMGFVQGLSLAPLAFIMTAAAFRAMNPSLEEAARIHGMGTRAILRRITLPLVLPAIAAAGIYILVIGIAAFDIPAIMGMSNRIYTFATYVYVKVLDPSEVPNYGLPAAVGILMFVIAVALTSWYSRFLRSSERYEVVTGKGYKVRAVPLTRWGNCAAWGFTGTFFLLSIGVPLLLLVWTSLMPYLRPPSLAALATLSFDQYRNLDWDIIWRGAKNSAILMFLAPTVTVALAISLAWVVVRSKSRWRYAFEFLSFLPHSLPAIVFGISVLYVAFMVDKAYSLYGTVWLIAIIYVVESIAFVSRVINGALMQIHRELEEVGYVSGLPIFTVLRKVFVPLVFPAILGVWLWRALVTFRELTVATTLMTPENITLPVVVWSQWFGVGLGPAAAVTLVIVAVLTPLILLYWAVAGRRRLEV